MFYGGVRYCSQNPLAPLFLIAPIYWNFYLFRPSKVASTFRYKTQFNYTAVTGTATHLHLSTVLLGGEQALLKNTGKCFSPHVLVFEVVMWGLFG